jgi:hypothetical protein
MPKKTDEDRIKQFKQAVARLREKYSNDEIGKRAKIDPTNLSSYFHGSKNPGKTTINKLYMAFKNELSQPGDSTQADKPGASNAPKQPEDSQQKAAYDPDTPPNSSDESALVRSITVNSQNDLLGMLQFTVNQFTQDKEHLRDDNKAKQRNLDEIIAVNKELAASNKELAASNKELAKTNKELVGTSKMIAANNTRVVDTNSMLVNKVLGTLESWRQNNTKK